MHSNFKRTWGSYIPNNNNNTLANRLTSAPIGSWKCNFPPFLKIIKDRPTNRPIGGPTALPISCQKTRSDLRFGPWCRCQGKGQLQEWKIKHISKKIHYFDWTALSTWENLSSLVNPHVDCPLVGPSSSVGLS